MWAVFAFAESLLAFVLAAPAILNAIKVANTRIEVLDPNWAYFAGMLFGDAIRLAPAALLTWHAIWIARRRIAFSRY